MSTQKLHSTGLRFREAMQKAPPLQIAGAINAHHDYDKIKEGDAFNFLDLVDFAPGKQLILEVVHTDGSKEHMKLNHAYNVQQIEWFKAGSALNVIKQQNL